MPARSNGLFGDRLEFTPCSPVGIPKPYFASSIECKHRFDLELLLHVHHDPGAWIVPRAMALDVRQGAWSIEEERIIGSHLVAVCIDSHQVRQTLAAVAERWYQPR